MVMALMGRGAHSVTQRKLLVRFAIIPIVLRLALCLNSYKLCHLGEDARHIVTSIVEGHREGQLPVARDGVSYRRYVDVE